MFPKTVNTRQGKRKRREKLPPAITGNEGDDQPRASAQTLKTWVARGVRLGPGRQMKERPLGRPTEARRGDGRQSPRWTCPKKKQGS